jgi:hypothetical protein
MIWVLLGITIINSVLIIYLFKQFWFVRKTLPQVLSMVMDFNKELNQLKQSYSSWDVDRQMLLQALVRLQVELGHAKNRKGQN